MRSNHHYLLPISDVAVYLGPIRDSVAFVGGAASALYIDDPTVTAVRATTDIDCVVEVATELDYQQLEARLRRRGFTHCTDEDAPMCRWRYKSYLVDIMPSDLPHRGASNRWYPDGMRTRITRKIGNVEVAYFQLPYFIGCKYEAFKNRGKGDWYASHDIEDIVAVMDGHSRARIALLQAESNVAGYLAQMARDLIERSDAADIVAGHSDPSAGRPARVLQLLEALSELRV